MAPFHNYPLGRAAGNHQSRLLRSMRFEFDFHQTLSAQTRRTGHPGVLGTSKALQGRAFVGSDWRQVFHAFRNCNRIGTADAHTATGLDGAAAGFTVTVEPAPGVTGHAPEVRRQSLPVSLLDHGLLEPRPGRPEAHAHRAHQHGLGVASRLGQTRRINVWLPPSYADGKQSYPVLYLHDGGEPEDFHHISGLLQVGAMDGYLRDVILIGIGDIDRPGEVAVPLPQRAGVRLRVG